MALIQLHKKGQMTLPQDVRARFGLDVGDLLDVEIQDDAIVLRPQNLVDASQAYFWSPEWQEAERQASDDLAQGRTYRFADVAAATAALRDEAAKRRQP